ncbi:hypothetical protein WJX81_000277 [Elliptochloris bilobata]|uniref:Uncharacterized protein n=1 Tax=Elliptochloris bilobata TaxID=381761 RepID=A0AAW1S8T8_9CHLO
MAATVALRHPGTAVKRTKATVGMDVDVQSAGSLRAYADASEPASDVAVDGGKGRGAQGKGVLSVRRPGKAGKRGALSHKQKRRKAQALEKAVASADRRESKKGKLDQLVQRKRVTKALWVTEKGK